MQATFHILFQMLTKILLLQQNYRVLLSFYYYYHYNYSQRDFITVCGIVTLLLDETFSSLIYILTAFSLEVFDLFSTYA